MLFLCNYLIFLLTTVTLQELLMIIRIALLTLLFYGLSISQTVAQHITKQEAKADLEQLEEYLVRYASYLHLHDIDYAHYLDSLEQNLEEPQDIIVFSKQIQKFIGLLGDAHSKVTLPNHINYPQKNLAGYLPFAVAQQGSQAVAVHPSCQHLWAANYPYIQQINDIPIRKLLKIAGIDVANASSSRYHHVAIEKLSNIRPILEELGADHGDHLHIILTNKTGTHDTSIYAYMSPVRKFHYVNQLTHPKGLIDKDENIAYLPIPKMYDKYANDELVPYLATVQSMHLKEIKNSDGLIIDLRGNKGGEKHILFELYPFFITKPEVVNVAISKFNKLNGLYKRGLYPIDHEDWTLDERITIESFQRDFHPKWNFNRSEFLDSYFYMVISPYDGAYLYDRPVVLLMDESCFSATAVFLSAFDQLDNVTLMGMPSAGGSGRSGRFTLTHSGILIKLSTMASFRANGELFDGQGIQPTIISQPTINDIIGESDTVLEQAIDYLIKKKQVSPPIEEEVPKDNYQYYEIMRNEVRDDNNN